MVARVVDGAECFAPGGGQGGEIQLACGQLCRLRHGSCTWAKWESGPLLISSFRRANISSEGKDGVVSGSGQVNASQLVRLRLIAQFHLQQIGVE
jgi:hypothetical protein